MDHIESHHTALGGRQNREAYRPDPGSSPASLLDALMDASEARPERPVCAAWERISRGYPPEPFEDTPALYEMRLSEDQVGSGTLAGLYALLAALSVPAAIAAAVYHVFHGRDTRRLAQLVAVAGLFVALELAAIWSLGDLLAVRGS